MIPGKTFFLICLLFLPLRLAQAGELCRLRSPDRRYVLIAALNEEGGVFYRVQRNSRTVVEDSPIGLRCRDADLSSRLSLFRMGDEELCRQRYDLLIGNKRSVDTTFNTRTIVLKNAQGSFLRIELAVGNEGVAFRCSFEEDGNKLRMVVEETTGFKIPSSASGWMQPYHAGGKYAPAYEDFYYPVRSFEMPSVSREKSRGWALPALFHVPECEAWMLIAESGLDGGYCASHLEVVPSKGYQIALAYEDEVTGAQTFSADAKQSPVLATRTPWRVIVIGDEPADIFNSTLVTDLAEPCQIRDTSWIRTGRASWSWWSHPDDKDTNELYNSFTDLADAFGWEYTLFDAGWWNADLASISSYAKDKGIKPLVWTHAVDFYDPEKRKRKLDDLAAQGIKGVKIDFWCSDRQETIAAMMETLKDAAERKLVVNFHGCTIPRGWHRTWPNLLTAEAVLGTECYFYEPTYPEKAAQLSTILPFTRNVMAPMDTTPVALTLRKFPRKTTATFELAAALIFTSGVIHYADSVEVLSGLPEEVRNILKDAPAAWDETICLAGSPGEYIVVARRIGRHWFIAGINGTAQPIVPKLDTSLFAGLQGREIREGKDPLMQFSATTILIADWRCRINPYGGLVLVLEPLVQR